MFGQLHVREDHGLARVHLPGDPVDEGLPTCLPLGLMSGGIIDQAYPLSRGVAVGPGRGSGSARIAGRSAGGPVASADSRERNEELVPV